MIITNDDVTRLTLVYSLDHRLSIDKRRELIRKKICGEQIGQANAPVKTKAIRRKKREMI